MADLDTYKDKVIVFEAIKASDSSRVLTRQPLQPSNTQLHSHATEPSHAADIKQGLDGASDENNIPKSAMLYGSLHPSRAMHGPAPHPGAQSNSHPLSPSSDRMFQAPPSHSHASGSIFASSKLPRSSVESHLISHSGGATPNPTSDHADGSVNMTGFDGYHDAWHDRIRVSYPDYNESVHTLVI